MVESEPTYSPDPARHAVQPAGFWIRFAATVIDAAIVFVAVLVASRAAEIAGAYLPIELILLITAVVYSALCLRYTGRTPGKACCGILVVTASQEPIGLGRALVRESIGKFVSGICALLGFIWVAISGTKRSWHDRLVDTRVIRDVSANRRARFALIGALLAAGCTVGLFGRNAISAIWLMRSMTPPADARITLVERQSSELFEASEFGDDAAVGAADWLDRHQRTPIEYAVATAKKHQVVIFGESHEREDELRFLNELIPELYHQAGVRIVAMEVCLAEDNAAIENLVTNPEFDRDMALKIARRQPWGLWGWKGYWDVLETVWRLNRELPPASPKMTVIGLDRPMDMRSAAMLGFEDNPAADCPLWEKLRIFRVVWNLPLILSRDAFMARQVEANILSKGQHGIVWVGRNHSMTNRPKAGSPRMGYMLRARYGDRVFQIRLHGMEIPVSLVESGYDGPPPMMRELIESIMDRRDNMPVGFDVVASPLANVRDGGSLDFHFDSHLGFADVAEGFTFLAPCEKMKTCRWLENYITPRMFAHDKPFYQAFGRHAGKEIRTSHDANALFSGLSEEP